MKPKKSSTPLKRGPKGPTKEIDWKQVQGLCGLQCTQEEIAIVLDVSVDTLQLRCKKELGKNFSEFFREFRIYGHTSLRRKQYEVGMSGDTKMLIWLGQNWLGQKSHQDVRSTSTIHTKPQLDLDCLSDKEAEMLLALMDKADADDNGETQPQGS